MTKLTKPTKTVVVYARAPWDHPLTWVGLGCLAYAVWDSTRKRQ